MNAGVDETLAQERITKHDGAPKGRPMKRKTRLPANDFTVEKTNSSHHTVESYAMQGGCCNPAACGRRPKG